MTARPTITEEPIKIVRAARQFCAAADQLPIIIDSDQDSTHRVLAGQYHPKAVL